MARKTYYQLLSEIKDYRPADRHFTSADEIAMLAGHFGLDDMSLFDLQNLRDMAVFFFGEIADSLRENGNKEESYRALDAMMSVTAVIDMYKAEKGGEL